MPCGPARETGELREQLGARNRFDPAYRSGAVRIPDLEIDGVPGTGEQRFAPDTELFRDGDPCDRVQVILAGRVRLWRLTDDGHVLVLRICAAGEALGQMSALEHEGTHSVNATTQDDCRVLAFPPRAFRELLERRPVLALQLAAALAERVRSLSDERRSPGRPEQAYRTHGVWVKGGPPGQGHYFRQQHEVLLLAVRGAMPTPSTAARVSSVIQAPRGRHSEKPESVYEIIEAMYPGLPKVELFARKRRPGWTAWGDQIGVLCDRGAEHSTSG